MRVLIIVLKKIAINAEAAGVRKKIKLRVESVKKIIPISEKLYLDYNSYTFTIYPLFAACSIENDLDQCS